MPRFRLLTRAQVNGVVREAGEIVTMPEGWVGPKKTVEHGHDRVDLRPDSETNGTRLVGELKEVDLYELVPDDEEVAPHIPVDGAYAPDVTAMAGGTQKMSDERLQLLEECGLALSPAEVTERDQLRQQKQYAKGTVGTQHNGQPAYMNEPAKMPGPDATHGTLDDPAPNTPMPQRTNDEDREAAVERDEAQASGEKGAMDFSKAKPEPKGQPNKVSDRPLASVSAKEQQLGED